MVPRATTADHANEDHSERGSCGDVVGTDARLALGGGGCRTASREGPSDAGMARAWLDRYAERHRPVRVRTLPPGVTAPKRVRIYARREHYLLQFWDPAVKRTLYDRVDGDLIDAIATARRIDLRLADFRASGHVVRRRVSHAELVAAFRRDLDRRADAQSIALATSRRYSCALDHYLEFAEGPAVTSRDPYAARVDREFALAFNAFLGSRMVSPNGHANSRAARMIGQDFVLDAVRAMFEWACDPSRGNLLPDGFRNPFRRRATERPRRAAADLAGEPDITLDMAATFLTACDDWQLRLFSPVVFYGLRPGELIYLAHEALSTTFLDVGCLEGLAYMTKGRRNKRLPMLEPMYKLLACGPSAQGLILHRRGLCRGSPLSPLLESSLAEMVAEFTSRSVRKEMRACAVARARDGVLRDAGALTYKVIQGEFAKVARALGWPPPATLKDFRHACNTALANGAMAEHERRYLLGQDPGRHAIVTYTHLNKIAEHYRSAVEREMAPLLEILARRAAR